MATPGRRPGQTGLRELTAATRNQLIGMRIAGLSYNEISAEAGVPKSTVRDTIKKNGSRINQESLPRSGRPVAFSPEAKRLIIQKFQDSPKITYAKLIEECCPGVHRNTVLRFVKTTNQHKWKCLKRTLLTHEDAWQRLQ